ncbi:hypothetical protein ABEG18_13985 [Alsobacter sp. KACC 23698]|uniref:Uncharacterized protein n=1 Tax=Alsobacter sp. KACC 23698 TaxID=3149229 RepID=A0AAU7J9F4_9HYPH
MLTINQAQLAGGFRSQEDVIMAELHASLAQVERLIERLSPHLRAQSGAPLRTIGAPAQQPAPEAAESLEKLQATAKTLRDGIAALSRVGHA